MGLTEQSIQVLTRRLPADKIKTRPGKAGMEYSYISPDFVIETLNEAFQFAWSTKVVYSERHDTTAVVGLELTALDADGNQVSKQQFGSCEISRGMGIGEAFKGAASDALKKCATLFGLGLELYQADEPVAGPAPATGFRPPARNSGSVPPPPKPPSRPSQPSAPKAPPVAPPAPSFGGGSTPPRPAAPPVAPPKPQRNPFAGSQSESSSPSAIQINSMTELASRRGLSPSGLISLAGIVDTFGQPVRGFEELNYNQAIQVIQAAQRTA